MKLQKRLFIFLGALILGLVLVACNKTTLTSIEIKGIEDVELENGEKFNILDGVTAVGDDDKDYTERITFSTTSSQVNLETGEVNTSIPGEIKVRYEVRIEVGEDIVLAQPWRTITVLRPERGDELIQNGIAYWEKYEASGGSVNVTEDEGGLKLEVITGSATHEPRISQMEVPYEMGKTYKISFEAKALEEKTINIQSGELLSDAPWFIEFHKGQIVRPTITTEWDTYEYVFKHVLDNQRGGLIFEFGPVGGKSVDTTLWIRNIKIEETEEVEDTIAPIFDGVNDVEVQLSLEFDPLKGITAMDNNDGDVTDKIVITAIYLDEEEVDEVDTSILDAVYTIHYEVSDEAGNKAEESRTVTIKDFSADFGNILTNGEFKDGINGWEHWANDANGAAMEVEVVNEELVISVSNVGNDPWDAQVTQENLRIEQNGTYKLSFTARATVVRDINVALGVGLDQDPWFIEYIPKQEGIELTTENQEFSFTFAIEKESTSIGKFTFEVGNTANAEIGDVIISNVVIEKALINNDFTAKGYLEGTETIHGHFVENAGETVHATGAAEKDKLTITVDTIGTEPYIPHYYYITPKLLNGTYEFKISITSSVDRVVRFNALLPKEGYASFLPETFKDIELKAGETVDFVIEFEVPETKDHVKFEIDFGQIGELESLPGVFVLENISLERK